MSNNNSRRTSRMDGLSLQEQMGEAFVEAAKKGDMRVVARSILKGVNVNYATKKGAYTALIKACRTQRVEVVKTLLEAGASVNQASHNGWTALIEAARVGHAELCKMLLAKPDIEIDAKNGMGWSALVEACRNEHVHIVKLLTDYGASVTIQDKDLFVPLDHASRRNVKLRKLLKSVWKKREAAAAAKEGRPIRNLIQEARQAEKSPGENLVIACEKGDIDQVKKLVLEQKVDVDSTNRNGKYTGLIMACRSGKIDIARFLIDNGANVNKPSEAGWSALIEACRVGDEDMLDYLMTLDPKPHVNHTNLFGWTALIEACRNQHYDIVEKLLRFGADPGIIDRDGDTPVDHTTHPWILGLLQDRIVYGSDGGPREKMQQVIRSCRQIDPSQAEAVVLKEVGHLLEKHTQQEDDDEAKQANIALRMDLLEVAVLELDVHIVQTLLKDRQFKTAALAEKRIIQAIARLPPPDDEDWKTDPERSDAKRVCEIIDAIIDGLFDKTTQEAEIVELLDLVDPDTGRTAALTTAAGYADITVDACGSHPDHVAEHGCPRNARWYMHILNHLLSLGASATTYEENGTTLLHFLLQPLQPVQSLDSLPALNEVLGYFKAIYGPNAKNLTRQINMADGTGKTPLSFLVGLNEHEEREALIMAMLDRGAVVPDEERPRLVLILRAAMIEPKLAWRVAKNAVRSSDDQLLHDLLEKDAPIYLVDPRNHTQQILRAMNPNDLPSRSPDEDGVSIEENLIHMAIERECSSIFETLLDYSTRPSASIAPDMPSYPWPVAGGDDANLALSWRNTYGQNAFHVCANKKSLIPSRTNSDFFRALLSRDVQAAVTRQDHYGWTPLHYAAYHNKLDTISMLIRANIDLGLVAESDTNPTALHLAAERGHWAVVLSLLKADAEVEVIDKLGCTPLALAMLARQRVDQERSRSSMEFNDYDDEEDEEEDVMSDDDDQPSAVVPKEATTSALVMSPSTEPLMSGSGSKTTDVAVELVSTVPHSGRLKAVSEVVVDQPTVPRVVTSPNPSSQSTAAGVGRPVRSATFHPTSQHEEESKRAAADQKRFFEERTLDLRSTVKRTTTTSSLGSPRDASDHDRMSKRETYSMTIEALLNHGASIAIASTSSGKSLYELMNVKEKWIELSRRAQEIEATEKEAAAEYDRFLVEHRHMPRQTFRSRRHALKKKMERQMKVMETRRNELFKDRESQMVIGQYYTEKIQTRHFIKLCRYVLFLSLLTVVGIYQATRDQSSAYYVTRGLEAALVHDQFAENVGPVPKDFGSIDADIGDIYLWFNGPLLGVLYPETTPFFYNGQDKVSINTGVISHQNVMLGRPRFRQVRSRTTSCDASDQFSNYNLECFTNSDDYDTEAFGPQNYTWSDAATLGTVPMWGRVESQTYDGSGFVIELPDVRGGAAARQEASDLFARLEAEDFIDAKTRALFLEFTLLNANRNHYIVSQMLLEFPLGGGIVASWDFHVSQLRRYSSQVESVLVVLEIIVIFMLVGHTWSELKQFWASRDCAYFKSFYNWCDMTIIMLAPIIIVLHVLSLYKAKDVEWDQTTEFLKVQELARYQYSQNILFSLMIFAAWMKLFDYMSVFRNLHRLIIMIEMMSRRLVNFFVIFCLVLAGFTSAEYVAYGYYDPRSYTWVLGFVSRTLAVFSGEPIVYSHTNTQRILGTFYVFLFLIIFSMLLMNLIIAMLTSAYDDALNLADVDMAMRQYDKMDEEGFTRASVDSAGGDVPGSWLELFDDWLVKQVVNMVDVAQEFYERCRARLRHRRSQRAVRKQKKREARLRRKAQKQAKKEAVASGSLRFEEP